MADRTVTVRLNGDVKPFLKALAQAEAAAKKFRDGLGAPGSDPFEEYDKQQQKRKRQAPKEGDEVAGAFARSFSRRLEAAFKNLPKVNITADSTDAQAKLQGVRSALAELSQKTIGVDVNASTALGEVVTLRQELERLDASAEIDVRADAAAALAQLEALQREIDKLGGETARVEVDADTSDAQAQLGQVDADVSRLDGRRARLDVDADVGGALASIALVGAALASLPAVTTVAVSVGVLGGALTAAGAAAAGFAAVAVPSLGRIGEALQAQETAAKSAGAATGGAGQSAAQAAIQAMQLEQAEKRLADAQRDERQAQEDLTRAREAGRRALEDMNFSLERSILSQKDAALAVREAEARLAETRERHSEGKASDLELERATLSYEMALQRSEEQEVKTARAREDTAKANKAGIEGTKEYQRALGDLQQAQEKVAQAEQQLKMLHLQQQAAMAGGGGAAKALTDAFADLSKQEKKLAKDIKAFKDEYLDWQRSLQPDVFPAIYQGLDLMRLGLREAGPLAKSAGAAFLQLGEEAEEALTGQFWQQFLFNVNTQIPGALVGLGRSLGNVTTGVAGIIDAFLPWTPTVVGGLESATKAFSEWGQSLKTSDEFAEFMLFVEQHAPEVWELIKNLAAGLINIGEALAPLGVGAFSGISLLAKLLAGMDPEHIQMIAVAILAIKAAQAGLSVARFFTEIPGRLEKARDGFDKTRTAASKFGDAVGGLKDRIGASGLVGGVALTGGLILLEKHFADSALAADRFAEKVQALGGSDIDAQIKSLTDEIARLQETVGPYLDLGVVTFSLDSDDTLDQIDALEARLEELRHKKELDAIASRNAGGAMAAMGDQAGGASQKMGDLNRGLDAFASRTDALQANQNLKAAFDETRSALEAANGKLQINARMTDEQKNAVIRAREAFSGLITQVRETADAQNTLTGRTTAARDAVLRQLPELMNLAGGNKEAQEQVLALARAYGISESDARKAARGGQDLVEVLGKLKSKDIRVGVDTRPAEEGLESFLRRYKNRSLAIAIQSKVTAAGALRTRSGVELMAAGGFMGASSGPPPNVATRPTFNASTSTLYGEAGKEAYIPYDRKYRDRALAILSQVASDFGLQVYGQEATRQVDEVRAAVDTSTVEVSTGLRESLTVMRDTMGDAGSLTHAIDRTGQVGASLVDGWMAGSGRISSTVADAGARISDVTYGVAGAVSAASEEVSLSIDDLTGSVLDLAQAVMGAKSAAATGSQKGGKQKGGSSGSSGMSRGSTNVPSPKSSGGMVAGHYGDPELQAKAALTNYSRVSSPQMLRPAVYSAPVAEPGRYPAASAAGPGGTVVQVDMPNATIREEADVAKLGNEFGFQLAAYG